MFRHRVFDSSHRRMIFLCMVGALLLANSGILSPTAALARQRVTAQQQRAHSALKQKDAWSTSLTERQPVIFVHGINENADHMGKSDFAPLYSALQPIAGSVQTFSYVDDQAYADTHTCPPKYTPCISQSAVLDNAIKLAGMISDLYKKTQHQITLIGYSMGAAIIRTALSGCQLNVTCQAVLGPKVTSMVNNVFFIDGVQEGSWMMQGKKGGIVPAAVAFLRQFNAPLFKLFLGSDVNANAETDLAPRSINIVSHDSTLPAKNIHYFNFYGNIVLDLKISNLFSTSVIPIDIGDGVVLPGTDNPQDTPFWGGARFCLQCNGENASQVDAGTAYRQWPLTVEKTIDLANQCTPLSVIQHDCILSSLFDLLTNIPQLHTNMPSAASLDGTAIQVADTTGLSGSKTTSIANEIALQLQVMPPTQTSCPTSGVARAAVLGLLAQGSDDAVVYAQTVKNASGTPVSATLSRYDVTTDKTTQILQVANAEIADPQVSADGRWIVFISSVGGSPAIQMIRMDGQGLQTLYCVPPTPYAYQQTIDDLQLSPDQKQLAFVSGLDLDQGNFSLLNMTDGTLQRALQPAPQYTIYQPAMWLNDTQLYVERFPLMQDALFLMDTRNGPDQSISTLIDVADYPSLTGFDVSPDRRQLFIGLCQVCGQGVFVGPSTISVQPATSTTQHLIYKAPKGALLSLLAAPDGKTLFFSLESYSEDSTIPADPSVDGVWKIHVDGTGLTHLFGQGFDFSLGNHRDFSNDGKWYILSSQAGLFVSSLDGGTRVPIASVSDATSTSLTAAGWTTM